MKIHDKMKEWKLHQHLDWKLQHVAVEIESQVQGWYNYYNKFGKTEFEEVMNHLNMVLAYWVRRKYKRFHRKPIVKAFIWLQEIAKKDSRLSSIGIRVILQESVFVQRVECEEPCEGRLSRTVL